MDIFERLKKLKLSESQRKQPMHIYQDEQTGEIKENPNFSNYLLHFEYDPLEELAEAIKSHDFFKAYSLGSTLFESYGKKILAKYFHNIDLDVMHGKIERMNLQTVILMLYTHKVIDKEFYLELTEIIKIRNKLIIHADITKAFEVNMWK
jgi:hypothetical protein